MDIGTILLLMGLWGLAARKETKNGNEKEIAEKDAAIDVAAGTFAAIEDMMSSEKIGGAIGNVWDEVVSLFSSGETVVDDDDWATEMAALFSEDRSEEEALAVANPFEEF